jgi:hypothetical protein
VNHEDSGHPIKGGFMELSWGLRKVGGGCSAPLWFIAAITLVACSPGFAFEVATFGGTEMDGRNQGFSYLAIDGTQKINDTVAVSARIMPNYLTYKYYSGDTQVKATSPGLYAVAGLKFFLGPVTLLVLGGLETRNTSLSPPDRNADVRGATNAGMVQAGIDVRVTKSTNVNFFGSYSGTNNFSYERGAVRQQISNFDFKKSYTFYVGAEQFIGRNADFKQEGVGPLLEMAYLPYNLSFGIRGGYKHDSTFGNGGYWGLQIYKGF